MNEVVPDGNSTFIESSLISTSNQDIDFMGLTSLTDPLKSDGHVIRAQAREGGLGVNAPFLLVFLTQGQSFDIAVLNITQGTLTTTFTEYEYALTPAEADSITDYSDLQVRAVASCNSGTCSAGGSRDTVQLSWVEFAVLDDPIIPPPVLDSVSVVNSSSLEVNFTAPVDLSNILSYDIRRFNGTGFETVGNILNGTTLSFVESGLIPDTFYRYHVVSLSSSDESLPSNEIGQRTTLILFSASPDSNTGVRWVNAFGNPPCTDLATFECVNEDVRDDNDFIQTTALGTSNSDIDHMTLSDIEDPQRSDAHFLKYTVREAGVGTNPVEFNIELRQGATVIANYTHTGLSSSYTFFAQELTANEANSITDYSDLEITITGLCDSGCTNQERERLNVSWIVFEIEQVSAPSIAGIDTLSSTSLRLLWTGDELDAEITDIVIQRLNVTDFINVGNVTISTFTFDDVGLDSQTIFKYRLKGMIPSGFSQPGVVFEGATPPTEADLDTQGATIEPSANNSFTSLQRQDFVQTVELYNLNETTVLLITDDMEINQLNAYESILKMINGTYDSSQELLNVGSFYGTSYLELSDVNQFLGNITDAIRNATGNTNEGDDNRIPDGSGT